LRRRKARELALKMLYQMELNGGDAETALRKFCEIFPYQKEIVDYSRFLLVGINNEQQHLDHYIEKASEHWKLSRFTYVDKNILRIGTYEMLFSVDVPPKVAIDEALELGKKFGSEDSKDFINGILDRILREHYEKGVSRGE
jgi:transcription antitermination protein NusB